MNKNVRIAKQLVKIAKNLLAFDGEDTDWFREDYEKIISNFNLWAKKHHFEVDFTHYPDFNAMMPRDGYQLCSAKYYNSETKRDYYANVLLKVDNKTKTYEISTKALSFPTYIGGYTDYNGKESNTDFVFTDIPNVSDFQIAFGNLVAQVW